LANTEFDVPLEPAIEAAKALVKSSLKAWGCLLLWASDRAGYAHGLTDETLTLVLGKLGNVSQEHQEEAGEIIEKNLAVSPLP
jgi:hypothetical protein